MPEPQQPDLSGMEPVESPSPAARPAFVPQPPYPPAPNPFMRSPLPVGFAMQPDALRYFYKPGGIDGPQYRILPQPPNATPAIGASASSQAITVVQEGQGTLLETNHVTNADQSTLDLIAGANISLVADKFGGVTINGTSTGDGIDHGDPIWWIDPAFIYLRDNFLACGNSVGTGGAGTVGQLRWDVGGTFTNIYNSCWIPPYLGGNSFTNSTTANQWGTVILTPGLTSTNPYNGLQASWPLFDFPSWKMEWIFYIGVRNPENSAYSLPHTSFYLGLTTAPAPSTYIASSTAARPPFFVGLRYDTDTTAPSIGDTTFWFEAVSNPNFTASASRINTQGNTFNTGITPAQGQPYRLEMICTQAGQVQMRVTPGMTSFQTLAVPTTAINSTSSSSFSLQSANGYGNVIQSATSTANTSSNLNFSSGSKITISGAVSPHTQWNGTFQCQPNWQGNGAYFIPLAGTDTYFPASGTVSITGYPGVLPFMNWGNDTSGFNSALGELTLNSFAFVWNPAVNPSNALTPNATKPRYW